MHLVRDLVREFTNPHPACTNSCNLEKPNIGLIASARVQQDAQVQLDSNDQPLEEAGVGK